MDFGALLQGQNVFMAAIAAVGAYLFRGRLGGGKVDPLKLFIDSLKVKQAAKETEKAGVEGLVELLKKDPEFAAKVKESL